MSDLPADKAILERASRVAAGWAFAYALYRAYYAAGGTVGMFDTSVCEHWRMVNAGDAVILAFGVIGQVIIG